jgi:magnesium chelatase family protein
VSTRPFRAPHHSVSIAGLIGGGGIPRPGEVSLAHNGVLFLDELLEFPRNALEALRQPVEDGRVVIARASASVSFPARFTLVGATNPCPCGHAGDTRRACSCAQTEVQRYRSRLSGPLADRIDMHLVLTPVPLESLAGSEAAEGSAAVRERVEAARAAQQRRAAALPGVRWNAHLPGRWLQQHGRFARSASSILARAAERLQLSARAYHRVLRVSRTIADLGGSAVVEEVHVAEALRFRPQVETRPPLGLSAAV